jgi:hypothetical protein
MNTIMIVFVVATDIRTKMLKSSLYGAIVAAYLILILYGRVQAVQFGSKLLVLNL